MPISIDGIARHALCRQFVGNSECPAPRQLVIIACRSGAVREARHLDPQVAVAVVFRSLGDRPDLVFRLRVEVGAAGLEVDDLIVCRRLARGAPRALRRPEQGLLRAVGAIGDEPPRRRDVFAETTHCIATRQQGHCQKGDENTAPTPKADAHCCSPNAGDMVLQLNTTFSTLSPCQMTCKSARGTAMVSAAPPVRAGDQMARDGDWLVE